eukprot:CAMPEP_0197252446 /NCGR_PEP_ID=MMETSP1429-20130617/61405_1 /TAXON_ID=49237 /ORGANISM="Chaetoceros  sp., Strain UNC1202" /LENGTH=62 /DNA_ID=CAMNT_0042714837 /DNA_START=26 /DNA_END=210 /DNA_ORIENTATION=-
MDDAIHGLALDIFQMFSQASCLPPMRPIDGFDEFLPVNVVRRELVKGDNDIRSVGLLGFDGG